MTVPIIASLMGFIVSSKFKYLTRITIGYLMACSLRDAYHRLSKVHDFFADILYFSVDH